MGSEPGLFTDCHIIAVKYTDWLIRYFPSCYLYWLNDLHTFCFVLKLEQTKDTFSNDDTCMIKQNFAPNNWSSFTVLSNWV